MLNVQFPHVETQEVALITQNGRCWNLTSLQERGVFLRESGLRGLVGSPSALVTHTTSTPGQVFHGVNVDALEGSLAVRVYDRTGRGCAEIAREFYSDFTTGTFFTLVFPTATGRKTIRLRLSAEIPLPASDPAGTSAFDVDLSVISDEGVWWSQEFNGTNSVTVTNTGHIPVSPKITWSGRGGEVTLPSGATFTLPGVQEQRTLLLGADASLAVVDTQNTLDRKLWLQVRGRALPETAPPKTARTYHLPPGARLVWKLGFLTPMR